MAYPYQHFGEKKLGAGSLSFVRLAFALLGSLWLCSGGLRAQDPVESKPSRVPIFHEALEVNIVNLDVVVTDKAGNPVSGLERGDFSISNDGNPVDITHFREIRDGVQVDAKLHAAASDIPSRALEGRPQLAVLFDNDSLEKQNRKRVIDSLRETIPQWLEKGSRILLAVAEGSQGAQRVQGFTSDPSKIETALKAIETRPTGGEPHLELKRRLRRDIARLEMVRLKEGSLDRPQLSEVKVVGQEIETVRVQEGTRIQRALLGLDEICRGLSGGLGRKHLVVVGQNLAMRPGLDIYRAFYNAFREDEEELGLDPPDLWGLEFDLNQGFKNVSAGAHGSEVVIHMIDAADHDSEVSRDWNLADLRTLFEGSQYVADVTGGLSFLNSQNFGVFFRDLERQVSDYYSLAYTLDKSADGELHRVKVAVKGQGYQVRHHELYRNRDLNQQLEDRALSQLFLETGKNDLGMRLSLAEGQPGPLGEEYDQAIVVAFPTNRAGFLPREAHFQADLQILVVVEDEEGARSPSQVIPLTLDIPESELKFTKMAAAKVRIKIKNANAKIVVAAKDQATGMEGVALLRIIHP